MHWIEVWKFLLKMTGREIDLLLWTRISPSGRHIASCIISLQTSKLGSPATYLTTLHADVTLRWSLLALEGDLAGSADCLLACLID